MRQAEINRKTGETDIKISLDIDGRGVSNIDTGCAFLDHMLTLFARHGRFDLDVYCKGDIEVDYHHTTEDIGIALGDAFLKAMGDKRGIVRYGSCILPMDESLILTAVDISGRSHLSFSLDGLTEKVGDFDTELVREFWLGFIRRAAVTLHIKKLDGDNTHHIIEGTFKSAARSLRAALAVEAEFADEIPSTKGVL